MIWWKPLKFPAGFARYDLHVHTTASPDSIIAPRTLVRSAKKLGLHGVAITDHDTLAGIPAVRRENDDSDFLVVPGVEIKTPLGEVGAYFLDEMPNCGTEDVPALLEEIVELGGFPFLPHPFDWSRNSSLDPSRLPAKVFPRPISCVEVLNSRCTFNKSVERANDFALRRGLTRTGGSDAHVPGELGTGATLIRLSDKPSDLEEFRNVLERGACLPCGLRSPVVVHACSTLNKVFRRVTGRVGRFNLPRPFR
ncbi:MAG: PHP domain-containing protein [Promethearchaeota archaeon]